MGGGSETTSKKCLCTHTKVRVLVLLEIPNPLSPTKYWARSNISIQNLHIEQAQNFVTTDLKSSVQVGAQGQVVGSVLIASREQFCVSELGTRNYLVDIML